MMKVFIYRTDTYLPAMREQAVRILSGEQDLSIVGDVTSVNGIADCYYDVVLVCAGHGDYAKVHHGLRMAGIPEERCFWIVPCVCQDFRWRDIQSYI